MRTFEIHSPFLFAGDNIQKIIQTMFIFQLIVHLSKKLSCTKTLGSVHVFTRCCLFILTLFLLPSSVNHSTKTILKQHILYAKPYTKSIFLFCRCSNVICCLLVCVYITMSVVFNFSVYSNLRLNERPS